MENLVYYEYAFNYLQLFIWTLREFWLEWDLKEVILYCCRIVKHDMNKAVTSCTSESYFVFLYLIFVN